MSRSNIIAFRSIRLNEYYLNNFIEHSSEDASNCEAVNGIDELKKRRHLRAMQSKNFIERAAMKIVDFVHSLAS